MNILKKYVPKSIKRFISNLLNGNYSYFLWIFPIKKNKIVLCNYFGKGFGDNGKYIVNKLIEENIDCDIVWLIEERLIKESKFPKNIRAVNYGSLKALYELATARLWIDNSRKLFYPPKRKEQYYIQTWHGGIALKQIEKDAEIKLSKDYIDSAKKDSNMANLFISNSRFCTNMYKSAFWYDGEILECGSPRCDILINKNEFIKEKVNKHFGFDRNSHIIIYAPTFRNDDNTNIYNIDFNRLVKVLENKFGGSWQVLVRLHPNISSKDDFMKYNSKIKNATNYDDMYELLAASD
uniref:CDP-glycerol glycerophosphotransferase family protein n=1 Tax=Clostridium sp. TaxID=1506 RepID=UPI00261BC38D